VPAVLAWQLGINQAAAEPFTSHSTMPCCAPAAGVRHHEGRRAIAAALGDGSPLAVSPVSLPERRDRRDRLSQHSPANRIFSAYSR